MWRKQLSQVNYREAPAGATSTAITAANLTIDLSSFVGSILKFQCSTNNVYYRFGSTSAVTAVTTDLFLVAESEGEEYFITTGRKFLSILGSGSTTFRYAAVGA